jgi:tetratricopeptide (TPR) repeat protein
MSQCGNRIRPRFSARRPSLVHSDLLCLTTALYLAVCAPLFAHDEPDEQIERLTQGIERDPVDAELYLARGGLHRTNRHWEAALANFDRAAQLDPYNSAIDFHRGRLYNK